MTRYRDNGEMEGVGGRGGGGGVVGTVALE